MVRNSLVPRHIENMSKHSKRYSTAKQKLTTASAYPLIEGIVLVKVGPTKFDAGVELHIKLGIDQKKSDQVVRGSVQLPHGTGSTKRVIAFVGSNQEAEASQAGADIIGTAEVIDEIKKTEKTDFDVAVATPDMMKVIAPIARILGQRGLMPNPKTDTVGPNVAEMVKAVKAGKINFKNDDGGNVHMLVGKVSFSEQQLQENIQTVIDAISKAKPSSAKGVFVRSVTLCSSMGPGIPVSVEVK